MEKASNRKMHTSDICISGKRISAMREIAAAMFGRAFMFIEVYDGRFVVTVNDKINVDDYDDFTGKYLLCKVRIYREVDISILRNVSRK